MLPMQPIYKDADGVSRFKGNAIVRYLLDAGPFDMNKLALMNFSNEDREQFAQLIGYSVCGFGELSYASEQAYEIAMQTANGENLEDDAKARQIKYLEAKLRNIKERLAPGVAELFGIHPDDLTER